MRNVMLAAVSVAIALGVGAGASVTHADRADRADRVDRPVPAGSRRVAGDDDRFVSGRGFGAAVDFYRRELSRRGVAYDLVGPYRARAVDVARFVLAAGAPWLAIHVYRQDGKTWIFFVKRPAIDAPRPP